MALRQVPGQKSEVTLGMLYIKSSDQYESGVYINGIREGEW